MYRFLAESIGEKVSSDNDEDIIAQADRSIRDEYADLGLPSGTLWAKCNLGAEHEWQFGDYYAWGETKPYRRGEVSVDFREERISWRVADKLKNTQDAAFVALGYKWHIPTLNQIKELSDNTYSFWCKHKGVLGVMFCKVKDVLHKGLWNQKNITSEYIGRGLEEHIFIPAAGVFDVSTYEEIGETVLFWSSEQSIQSPWLGGNFYASKSKKGNISGSHPLQGLPIRAVCTEKDII